jgi:EmrB/QacA subfamily drug resistance transporter
MDDARPTVPPFQNQPIRVVFGALMLVMLLASLDQTIISTALPTIVGELGGLAHLSWIVTAYLLASTIVTPLYGKLGDLFGRKVVLQSAIFLFLIGSALCGISQTMGELVGFRALQGLGGGGLMVTIMAVIGDIFSPRERGRYQGIFGGVFGLSTVLGPLIGGFFVEHLSWRWIFYVNLPLGLIAVAIIGLTFTSPSARRRPSIDVAGASLLTVTLTALIVLTSLGGQAFAWGSLEVLGLVAALAVGLVGFIAVERRAAEPILPLQLFSNRVFVISCAVGFIVGLGMFGAVTFMPMYLQVVKGVSPTIAGFALTPMMAGVLVTSIASGQIISRIGRYRSFPIAGTAVMTVGLGLLATLGVSTSVWTACGYMLVLGLGLGMVMQVLVLAVQNAVEYRDLGVATSGTTLFRSIGGSVGVSLFGTIFTATLTTNLAGRLLPGAALPAATAPDAIWALPIAVRTVYLEVFTAALHPVFLYAAWLATLGFALTWFLKELPCVDWPGRELTARTSPCRGTRLLSRNWNASSRTWSGREHRWEAYRSIAETSGIRLAPDEIWLLVQLYLASAPVELSDLADRFNIPPDSLGEIADRVAAEAMAVRLRNGTLRPSSRGRETFKRVIATRRAGLARLLERWSPESHSESRRDSIVSRVH